ncbi:tetratricopeptide repeat protein [Polyangium aurulentum]|uniref:tetratricopeptide repeat protein n=1 Tax=Polyangium aurulentum TaxID=2567896 RepID=UPI001F411CA9|nr:tetratricopeptide repeat protein [Polyangium aurulentum]
MRKKSLALVALAAALLPALAASCTETAQQKPPQQPQQQQPPYGQWNPQQGMMPGQTPPIVGMNDRPSSMPTPVPTQPQPQPQQGAPPVAAPQVVQPSQPAMSPGALGPYQQGMAAWANGDLASARGFFQQATSADPRAHQAFYSLGVVQERLRDPNAAASYRQAFTIQPDYEPAIVAYAMILAKKGSLPDAERVLNEKRGQMPRSAAVAASLAEIKSLQKDTGSAQRLAQEALKINPDYRPAMVIIARDHYRNRRLDLALYALTAILDGFGKENPPRDKDNPEALLLRGLIYREQGQRGPSLEQFKRAVERRPDLVEARVQLATLLLEAGNAQEALPLLEGAIRYDADHVPARLELGDTYRLLGRYADAKRELEWVLARDASLPQVHYNLGLLYLFAPSIPGMTAKQQVAEAIRELKRYQELRRKNERDDSDELLNRAKLKEGELNAAVNAEAPAPAAPLPAGSAGAGTAPAPQPGGAPAPPPQGSAPAPQPGGAPAAPAPQQPGAAPASPPPQGSAPAPQPTGAPAPPPGAAPAAPAPKPTGAPAPPPTGTPPAPGAAPQPGTGPGVGGR